MTFKVSDVYVTVIKVIKKYITVKLCRKKCQKKCVNVPKSAKNAKRVKKMTASEVRANHPKGQMGTSGESRRLELRAPQARAGDRFLSIYLSIY